MAKPKSKSAARILWVTDPWSTLDHPKDTSLRLMEESIKLGIETFWCDVKSIRLENGKVLLVAARLEAVAPGRGNADFRFAASASRSPIDFTRIIYRTDPPVDLAYLQPLQLLHLGIELATPRGARKPATELVNAAETLFTGNEKLEGALLKGLFPPTLAASQWDALRAFGEREGKTVLKPLHEAQSKGVELLDWSSPSACEANRAILARATEQFQRPVLLQRYLPGIAQGEQRLWFLNGKCIAVARKNPKSGEFRINMDQGATLSASRLDPREKKAAAQIGRFLRSRKIRLAAVDLIEGYVTDFNFTSPGLLTAIESVVGKNLAAPIVRSLIASWK